MPHGQYRVFVSHGGQDRWIAAQIARAIREVGAAVFLDGTDVAKGEHFKKRIQQEVGRCHELVALLTPRSAKSSWVWAEIGAAWSQEKLVIAVFYGLAPSDLEESGQGKAMLEDLNILELTDFDIHKLTLPGQLLTHFGAAVPSGFTARC